eukprot:NODE_515_length_6587_cov_0.940197.p5 type:complete len:271 gc:universal NODE_515_length_6587_cov_0.940197:3956-3144(-)
MNPSNEFIATRFNEMRKSNKYDVLLKGAFNKVTIENCFEYTDEDFLNMAKYYAPKHINLAKQFNRELFAPDLTPVMLTSSNSFGLNFQRKVHSSILENFNDSCIYFNDIHRVIVDYCKSNRLDINDLEFLDISNNQLCEDDLQILQKLIKAIPSLKAIDLMRNKITLYSKDALADLNALYSHQTIQINFNGNYCENDKWAIINAYGAPTDSQISASDNLQHGYIWIYEHYVDHDRAWIEFLTGFGYKDKNLFETIKEAHVNYYEFKNSFK